MGDALIPDDALAMVRDAAEAIRDIETAAKAALHDKGDEASYRAGMAEKCRLLIGLPDAIEELLEQVGGAAVEAFRDGLRGFADRAGQALSLQSVFYMSALLYPDDYVDGQQNDLERFLTDYS